MKIVAKIEETNPFKHAVTPHTLRHTFAIRHLNAGVDVKIVARWLTHKSVTITEKHYAHAIHGTLVASDDAFDQSERRQAEQRRKQAGRIRRWPGELKPGLLRSLTQRLRHGPGD